MDKESFDLFECLEYNPQDGITEDSVCDLLAVVEGERDTANWHWVVALRDKKFALIIGGCDFTGWHCQSWAESFIGESAIECAQKDGNPGARDSLMNQIQSGVRIETWREVIQKDFNYPTIFIVR